METIQCQLLTAAGQRAVFAPSLSCALCFGTRLTHRTAWLYDLWHNDGGAACLLLRFLEQHRTHASLRTATFPAQ